MKPAKQLHSFAVLAALTLAGFMRARQFALSPRSVNSGEGFFIFPTNRKSFGMANKITPPNRNRVFLGLDSFPEKFMGSQSIEARPVPNSGEETRSKSHVQDRGEVDHL